jgi:7-cyano-7-deazaguanine reductase
MKRATARPLTNFEALGRTGLGPSRKLEVFPRPDSVTYVKMTSTEFTSLCPVTGQPDFCTVEIEYWPAQSCIESKSLKLYLWTFREEGHFCEALAALIAADVAKAINPNKVRVTVHQQPRGGISIDATAEIESEVSKEKQRVENIVEN